MTIEQAKALNVGDTVHYIGAQKCLRNRGPRGGVRDVITRCKVTSVKTWKTNPHRVKVGVKHGMYSFGNIKEDNLWAWHLESECPLLAPLEYEA